VRDFFVFVSPVTNLIGAFRARNAAPEAPAAIPVSITHSLSVPCQREAELADAQARQADSRVTADAALQATQAAEDRAMMAERAAALAEREVGFYKALNVRLLLDCRMSLSPLRS